MLPQIATYEDVIAELSEFKRSRMIDATQDTIRYAIQAALREIVTARDWVFLRKPWRVPLQAPQSTGTVTYTAAGGAYPYLCTLSGATVPTWAADGVIRIGTYSTPCDIDAIIDSTNFTLRYPRVPTADIDTGTTYEMGRSWYELPAEYMANWSPTDRNAWYVGEYVPFDDWHLLEKYRTWSGSVRRWTIGPAPNRYGTMALYVDPWSATTAEYDFVMKCRPRTLTISGQESWSYRGTVTVSAGGTTVTGTSTDFRSNMVGAIMRFGTTTARPTSVVGSNPYAYQQSIASVNASAQTLVLGSSSTTAYATVKYTISDPIDMPIHVYDAFLRNCEFQMAHATGMKDADKIERRYQVALAAAKMADAQARPRDGIGQKGRFRARLADNPNRSWVG